MPVYTVGPQSGWVKNSFEQSPAVALETDQTSAEGLPAIISAAADAIILGSLDAICSGVVPDGADGVITWLGGDRLIEGSAAIIRRDLRAAGRRCFVPVHFPCLPALDLLSVEPRWISGASHREDYWSLGLRISSTLTPSPHSLTALRTIAQPWARLVQALLDEQITPGVGIEVLDRMHQDNRFPAVLSSLALRNLAVLLIRHNELQKAEQLLEYGMRLYAGYAELTYVAAILCFRRQQPSKALALLKQPQTRNQALVGSGGENSYRTDWLMGLLAAQVGNQRLAFERFREGMISRPVFTPAVDELLKLRCPAALVEKYQWDFCRLVRREPRYLEAVFNYLLLHRAFPAARRIADTVELFDEKRNDLRQRLESAVAPFRPGRNRRSVRSGIMLSGPVFEHSSAARVNRELGMALLQLSEFDACLEPSSQPALLSQTVPRGDVLFRGLLRHPQQLDLTIRSQSPPDFQRPPRGKLAVLLSWGYGAVPRIWIEQIERNVNELWVPSNFVRDTFVRCGVSRARIQVIPAGVDTHLFCPEGPVLRPGGCRKFMFLFVGRASRRRGVDLLLEAYREAFDPGDDVTLIISAGSKPMSQEDTMTGVWREFAQNPNSPHLLAVAEQYDDQTLASLYRGCDAFVMPYRAEGWGMGILEAMACGKPAISTVLGPARDFCSDENAYLVSALATETSEGPTTFGDTVGELTWFEPDARELAQALRRAYENREECVQRGRAAAREIRQRLAWANITPLYLHRIQQLVAADETPELAIPNLTLR